MGAGRGPSAAAPSWRIGIEDPRRPGAVARVVTVRRGAVATSGAAARGAHVVDPRTGSGHHPLRVRDRRRARAALGRRLGDGGVGRPGTRAAADAAAGPRLLPPARLTAGADAVPPRDAARHTRNLALRHPLWRGCALLRCEYCRVSAGEPDVDISGRAMSRANGTMVRESLVAPGAPPLGHPPPWCRRSPIQLASATPMTRPGNVDHPRDAPSHYTAHEATRPAVVTGRSTGDSAGPRCSSSPTSVGPSDMQPPRIPAAGPTGVHPIVCCPQHTPISPVAPFVVRSG